MALNKAREVALKILYDVNEKQAYSNISLNRYIEENKLSDPDRGLVSEIVYGTLKWKLTIDYIIEQHSNVKLKKLSPWILNILRLGIYQLLYADRIPESAAVNESVTLAKRYGHSASSGYVNAVLRNVARKGLDIRFPDDKQDVVKYLSVKYSHPEWLVKKWTQEYGRDFAESLLKSNNQIPAFSIRVNLLKTTKDELKASLEEKGYKVLPGKYINEALIIENPAAFMHTDSFKQGHFMVQDESSMLVSRILAPEPGDVVVDVCSAPGGKASHMAEMMNNKGRVIARDIFDHKVKMICDNAARLGIGIIEPEIFDSAVFDDRLSEKADKVLVDAPCTGLGILRRKPEIRWSREIEDLESILNIQYRILYASSGYVKPGGMLVYSTCTINREENENMVGRFLENNQEFSLTDINALIPVELKPAASVKGCVQTYPNTNDIDGFFIAKLQKNGNTEREKQ
jgi:16S rRNA (cytosine967-C5)-methyltransferase